MLSPSCFRILTYICFTSMGSLGLSHLTGFIRRSESERIERPRLLFSYLFNSLEATTGLFHTLKKFLLRESFLFVFFLCSTLLLLSSLTHLGLKYSNYPELLHLAPKPLYCNKLCSIFVNNFLYYSYFIMSSPFC